MDVRIGVFLPVNRSMKMMIYLQYDSIDVAHLFCTERKIGVEGRQKREERRTGREI